MTSSTAAWETFTPRLGRGCKPATRCLCLPLIVLELVGTLAAHSVKVIAEAVLAPRVTAGGTIAQRLYSTSLLSSFAPPPEPADHPSIMPEDKVRKCRDLRFYLTAAEHLAMEFRDTVLRKLRLGQAPGRPEDW
jgi:hypothetical protein